jgi:biotin carboxyl carrier protein
MASVIQIGNIKVKWKVPPRSPEGSGELEMENGTLLPVSWKVDASGVWVNFPHGTFGYDIRPESSDSEVQYQVSRRRGPGEWESVQLSKGSLSLETNKIQQKSKSIKVKSQMPGKIIRVFVKAGQILQKGESVLVMEAMKMENEMKAPETGTLVEIKVREGQAVDTGFELYTIEPKK